MIKEYVMFALKNIAHRKRRNFLTIIAIVIGLTAIISLVSLGQGLQVAISEQFEMMGTDKIFISPGGPMFGFLGGSTAELTDHDINIIKKTRGVKLASGMIFKTGKLEFHNEKKDTWIIGVPTDSEGRKLWQTMQSVEIEDGRFLEKGENYKMDVGYLLGYGNFFEKQVKVGDRLSVEGNEFRVVGIVSRVGNNQDDSQVYIPLETAREMFNEPDKYDFIIVQTESGFDAGSVAEDIKKRLRDDRSLKKGEEDFSVQTNEQLRETFDMVFILVAAVVIGIASISLLVGGIGIMNTMYTSVLERTREIGIMKAIGARNSDIMLIFLIESGLLGLVGGAIGIALGIGVAKLVEIFAAEYLETTYITATASPGLILFGLLFAFFAGVLSGTLPARHAARLRPVEALKY